MVDRIESAFDEHGYGLWAVEATGVTLFARLVGLSIPRLSAHFTPAVEVGWRLAPAFWSRGHATEGALAAVEFGLDTLQLDEVVSFTSEANFRSRRVMETPMIDRLTGEAPAALKSFTDMEPVGAARLALRDRRRCRVPVHGPGVIRLGRSLPRRRRVRGAVTLSRWHSRAPARLCPAGEPFAEASKAGGQAASEKRPAQ